MISISLHLKMCPAYIKARSKIRLTVVLNSFQVILKATFSTLHSPSLNSCGMNPLCKVIVEMFLLCYIKGWGSQPKNQSPA